MWRSPTTLQKATGTWTAPSIRTSSSAIDLAAFDFDAAMRWARLAPNTTLSRRAPDDLPFLSEASAGPALLLDTCVYIDRLQGRAPEAVAALLGQRVVNHSTVALQELMHT